jgi:hypothetical protein
MKLAYVDLCGFRGYRKPLRLDFADDFTIIDGRNGVGKSTVFDAVEFALSGTIAKYADARADGESIADYVWWSEGDPRPENYYVEVGFRHEEVVLPVRRTKLDEPDKEGLRKVLDRLCDNEIAPDNFLPQLFATSIIRDESIATLSLDLKETERYALVCGAIGATDASDWIDRGQKILTLTKKRVQNAEKELTAATAEMSSSSRRIDEIRAGLVEESTLAEASSRLSRLIDSTLPVDQLIEPARTAIGQKAQQLDTLRALERDWAATDITRKTLPTLLHNLSASRAGENAMTVALAAIREETGPADDPENNLPEQAQTLLILADAGQKIGLHDGHCPLCASRRTEKQFSEGLKLVKDRAERLDREAAEKLNRVLRLKDAENQLAAATATAEQAEQLVKVSQNTIGSFEGRLKLVNLGPDADLSALHDRIRTLEETLELARADLGVLETIKLNAQLARAHHTQDQVKEAYARAQDKMNLARKAEQFSQTLYDAARRAAGETVDERLDRILPLMSELYRRLRPHPVWRDIEYKIRGDVQRFLKLQVGEKLNPQFMFSSGQRRATGLAFLLSVNLSLAWSRWRTIMLDDPVQHIDDFRSVELSEVLAQLSADGRQIVCAVEDPALADLLCRRLPIHAAGSAKRVTLGPDSEGALAKVREEELAPLPYRALITESQTMAG